MKYQWLLFDADGTLFDYDAAENHALATTFSAFTLPYNANLLDIYREINDEMWQAFEREEITQEDLKIERFKRLLVSIGVEDSIPPGDFSHQYLHNLGNCTFLIDDAESVLHTLSGTVHLALITNGLKAVQRSRLAQSTIGHYFEVVLISEELGVAKPHPGIFDAAFAAMGNPPKYEVMIIGDSLSSDIKGGYDYGITTCWFNPHLKPCSTTDRIDYEIQNLKQILDIVPKLIQE
jgi:2-haloacid dehalogenase